MHKKIQWYNSAHSSAHIFFKKFSVKLLGWDKILIISCFSRKQYISS